MTNPFCFVGRISKRVLFLLFLVIGILITIFLLSLNDKNDKKEGRSFEESSLSSHLVLPSELIGKRKMLFSTKDFLNEEVADNPALLDVSVATSSPERTIGKIASMFKSGKGKQYRVKLTVFLED